MTTIPDETLERRRAQNRIAQRRFRQSRCYRLSFNAGCPPATSTDLHVLAAQARLIKQIVACRKTGLPSYHRNRRTVTEQFVVIVS